MAAPRHFAELLSSRTNPDLRRGGREVGYALVRRTPPVVDALRDAVEDAIAGCDLAEATPPPGSGDGSDTAVATAAADDAYGRGYRAALVDTLAGFAAALESWLEVEHAATTLGVREAQVLRALLGEARPQVRLARDLAMAPHEVSRAAKRLRATGLVKAYPGERETEQLHRLTALGRAVVHELEARAAHAEQAAADDDRLATGTPPIAEAPLYAEEAWSPASEARPARAPSPDLADVGRGARAANGGDVHELDTATSRWRSRGHAGAAGTAGAGNDEDE